MADDQLRTLFAFTLLLFAAAVLKCVVSRIRGCRRSAVLLVRAFFWGGLLCIWEFQFRCSSIALNELCSISVDASVINGV